MTFTPIIFECMMFASMIFALYNRIKKPIGFLCKQELNLKFLIQPTKTLQVVLTKSKKM